MEEKTNGGNSGWGEEGKAFGFERFARVELNGKPDITSETQDRILSVIDELGYSTNLAARNMLSRAKNLVGLIMLDIAYPFAVEVIQEVNHAIAEFKSYPLVYTMDDVRKEWGHLYTSACRAAG